MHLIWHWFYSDCWFCWLSFIELVFPPLSYPSLSSGFQISSTCSLGLPAQIQAYHGSSELWSCSDWGLLQKWSQNWQAAWLSSWWWGILFYVHVLLSSWGCNLLKASAQAVVCTKLFLFLPLFFSLVEVTLPYSVPNNGEHSCEFLVWGLWLQPCSLLCIDDPFHCFVLGLRNYMRAFVDCFRWYIITTAPDPPAGISHLDVLWGLPSRSPLVPMIHFPLKMHMEKWCSSNLKSSWHPLAPKFEI